MKISNVNKKTLLLIICISGICIWTCRKIKFNSLFLKHEIGTPFDSLNHVIVYYNGKIDNVTERNVTKDGYNLGLKYQCVEFVKRYYYQHLNHKMPDSYGHAKDFFNTKFKDGKLNNQRDLIQFTNPSSSKPQINDLLIFDGHEYNPFGHVAIISNVDDDKIEIIQQNSGVNGKTRENFILEHSNNQWHIKGERILGWLRKE